MTALPWVVEAEMYVLGLDDADGGTIAIFGDSTTVLWL
jgi:hypothetical protein